VIRSRLKEPERWSKQKEAGADSEALTQELGSVRELFTDPTLRRNTIVGMTLAFAGVVGLWGIGFFSFDLIRSVFKEHFESQGLTGDAVNQKLAFWVGITSLLQNAGAFFGGTAIWSALKLARQRD